MIIIGLKVFRRFKEIEQLIDKIFSLSQFTQPNELLLLEELRQKLFVYDSTEDDINQDASWPQGTHRPVVPTMNIYLGNYYQIYEIFIKLQKIVLIEKKKLTYNQIISKAGYLSYSEKYKECRSLIKKVYKKLPENKKLCR